MAVKTARKRMSVMQINKKGDVVMSQDHAQLRCLLSERNQYSERAASIDQQIHNSFNARLAPLVLDTFAAFRR